MLEEYKKLLTQFISLKSVSSDSSLKEECAKTANFLADYLGKAGFTTNVVEGYGHPVLLASYETNPKLPTCLIYGHYDVQPANITDGWESDPFTLTEKENRFFGRGTMDDKGQLLIHIVAIVNLIKEGKLQYNIKFLSEGNEETGSPYIKQFIIDHKNELQADFVMLSDEELLNNHPTINLGFRGTLNMELTITTATNELHSGIYGGAAPNAAHVTSKLISSFHDEENKVRIKDFYTDVEPIEDIENVPFDFELYQRNTGARAVLLHSGNSLHKQTGLLPSLEIVAVEAGYIGEGMKTILPAKTKIKINVRLVKNQNPQKVAATVEQHIRKYLPPYATYSLEIVEFAHPAKVKLENAYVQKAITLLERIYNEKAIKKYVGGTEPVIAYFQELLDIPQALVPFANDDGHMHGINENFAIPNIKKGLEFSSKFFSSI